MRTSRLLIAALALVAVATNAAVAALASCQCEIRPLPRKNCCSPLPEHAAAHAACCCIDSQPLPPISQDLLTKPSLDHPAVASPACIPHEVSIRSESNRLGEPAALSGPPLLALYCVWLK